ncbi:MAG: hypothetical protein J0H82_27225 [Alphaproteobacteria bacterium]|jgi:hypothetical protein|nr:hypothetical protein [Alphaproteobacteria bacterium]
MAAPGTSRVRAAGTKQQKWRRELQDAGLIEARVWVPASAKPLIVDIGNRIAAGEDTATLLIDIGRRTALPPVALPLAQPGAVTGAITGASTDSIAGAGRGAPPVENGAGENAAGVSGGQARRDDAQSGRRCDDGAVSPAGGPAAASAEEPAGVETELVSPAGPRPYRPPGGRRRAVSLMAPILFVAAGVLLGRIASWAGGAPAGQPPGDTPGAGAIAIAGAPPSPGPAIELEVAQRRVGELTIENDQLADHLQRLLGEIAVLSVAIDEAERRAVAVSRDAPPSLDVAKVIAGKPAVTVARDRTATTRVRAQHPPSTSDPRRVARGAAAETSDAGSLLDSNLPPVPLPPQARSAIAARDRQ